MTKKTKTREDTSQAERPPLLCTTCGAPVKPGATCQYDGQIAPRE
ncbi:MAG TPA: hypothetical protein VMY76_00730 [Gemmatimonadales bacterium]|nr:hypothetical protein [Gemmatimonadales bacterium]